MSSGTSRIKQIVWLSFIDNMLVICDKAGMAQTKEKFTKVGDFGPMQENIGKIDVDEKTKSLEITQPVLVQSLKDIAGTHLLPNGPKSHREDQTKYHSGVSKLLYLVKWSHPEIVNSVHELTRFMTQAYPVCMKGLE